MQIVRTHGYVRDLKKLKASAADVETMELAITTSPTSGALIQGLRGVRKVRFRIANRGKSGGGRAIYFFVTADSVIVMLMACAKAEKTDLSPGDRKSLLRILEELEL
jgi:hypothetical protein